MDVTSVLEAKDVAVRPLPGSELVQRPTVLLRRMFVDPHLLAPEERSDLVEELRHAVAKRPEVAELRVVLGMALCVNLDVQDAIEELRTAVELAPESFIAQLKMGELWMRLRVMDKAEEHTRRAGLLARNAAHADLARRQAAAIRALRRDGVERGGYRLPMLSFGRLRRWLGLGRGRWLTAPNEGS